MSKSTEEAASGCLAILFVFLVVLPIRAFLGTWLMVKLWHWFVVPLHVTPIGWWHAFGLSTLIGWLTYHGADSKSHDDDGVWSSILRSATRTVAVIFFTYLLGWLAHANMS